MSLYKRIANAFPDLSASLYKARINQDPEEYVKRTVMSSLYVSLALLIILFSFTKSLVVFAFTPILFPFVFIYLFNVVYKKIRSLEKEISKEIVYAGRFLIIELESGIPMYNTFENIGNNYAYVGIYFNMVIEKVRLGTSIDDAISETIDICPSEDLRKIFWQILNSIKTGANISTALNGVLENIVREQNIIVKEFGNKLNPLAMFYMMIAIIVPSLGVTMLVVLASFIHLKFSLLIMMVIAVFIGFIQFMFLMLIKSSRPNIDM